MKKRSLSKSKYLIWLKILWEIKVDHVSSLSSLHLPVFNFPFFAFLQLSAFCSLLFWRWPLLNSTPFSWNLHFKTLISLSPHYFIFLIHKLLPSISLFPLFSPLQSWLRLPPTSTQTSHSLPPAASFSDLKSIRLFTASLE